MLLFGSRCRGAHRPDSDIDVFIEDESELLWFHPHRCVEFGGPVDAFWWSDSEWTTAVLDDTRALLLVDKWGPCIEVRPITRGEFTDLLRHCPGCHLDPPATLEEWRLLAAGATLVG